CDNFRAVDLRDRLATTYLLAGEVNMQFVNSPTDAGTDARQLCLRLFYASHHQEFMMDDLVLDNRRLQTDGALFLLRHLNTCCWLVRFGRCPGAMIVRSRSCRPTFTTGFVRGRGHLRSLCGTAARPEEA